MKHFIRRGLSVLLLLALVVSLLPILDLVPTAQAANLSTDIYQLPSKTLNDAGTKYRQNMSYIIRTRNGKIIVIDGGYSTNNSDANYLISQLKSITGKDVPNVDAWFFTHDHGDHVGAFKAVAARMPTSLTVDTVYYRFATDAEIDKYAPEADRASLKTSTQSFRNHVKLMKKADGTPTDTMILSARHVNRCNGVFTIDTVQIDVLMTCQEVFWGCDNITTQYSGSLSTNGKAYTKQTIKQLVEADFGNNTTSVFRLTTMGQSVLFLGDAAEPEGLMLKYFHDKNAENSNNYFSLKSDIVQMAHHGQNAVPKSVYTAINPDIALWPTPDWVYNPSSSSGLTTNYTKQWMSELGVTNYISKDGLKKISLNDLRTPDVLCAIPEELKPLVFDATYYADKYGDVKKAFGYDEASLYNHFLKYGVEEGRCASPYFDIKYYMSQNSLKLSVYCKGSYEKGMDHFIKYAYEEVELTGGGAKKLSPIFDCKYYYNNYPVLKELGLKNEFEILQYYVSTGKAAGHKAAAEVVTLNGGVVYHTVSKLAAVEPTCTAEGKTAGSKCATCGLILTAQTAVAAKGHSYTDTVTPPTCSEGGYTTHTCTVCGHAEIDSQTEASGHSYSSATTAPTCTAEGYTTYTCTVCNHSYVDDVAEALGHNYDAVVTAPTCSDGGYTTYTCSVCAHSYTDSETAPTGHSYTDTVTPPTCEDPGITAHVCDNCGYTYWDSMTEATGHSYSYTETEDGHLALCACGASYTEAHSFTEGLCVCGAKEVTVDESIPISHTLNLASDISINFVVRADLLASYDSYVMEILIPEYEGDNYIGTNTLSIEPELKGYFYYFTLSGLTAVQMNDTVEATLYMVKGERIFRSNTDRYSIATYAYNQLNQVNTTEALKKLCADLLQYGSKAQIYKGYRTELLAGMKMTEAHKAFLTDPESVTFGDHNRILEDLSAPTVTWVGKTLSLESKVVVRYVVNLSGYTGAMEDLILKVSYVDSTGETLTAELKSPTVFNEAQNMYAFDFQELLAAELRTVLTAAVYEGETQVSASMEYSVDTYCNNKTGDLGELCKALIAYSDSAAAFFAQ